MGFATCLIKASTQYKQRVVSDLKREKDNFCEELTHWLLRVRINWYNITNNNGIISLQNEK